MDSLILNNNRIENIPIHGISHMPALKILDVSSNLLRTLRANIFNPDDYPDSNGCPAFLELHLSGNGLQCNTTLCWLIETVDSGTVDLGLYVPECANYGDSSILLVNLVCALGNTFLCRSITSLWKQNKI